MSSMKKPALALCVACAMTMPGLAWAADELIEASGIINSNISNGLNSFGAVTNVLLDEDGKSVEYLFFEASETFSPTRSEKGFVEMSNVDFARGSLGEWEVLVEDTDAQRKPEELQVTRSEADHRLLSNVMDESIQFADQQSLRIDDILINPDTGQIEYFTVETDATDFFDEEVRAIPASEVTIGSAGKVSTSVPLSDVSSNSKYQLSSR